MFVEVSGAIFGLDVSPVGLLRWKGPGITDSFLITKLVSFHVAFNDSSKCSMIKLGPNGEEEGVVLDDDGHIRRLFCGGVLVNVVPVDRMNRTLCGPSGASSVSDRSSAFSPRLQLITGNTLIVSMAAACMSVLAREESLGGR